MEELEQRRPRHHKQGRAVGDDADGDQCAEFGAAGNPSRQHHVGCRDACRHDHRGNGRWHDFRGDFMEIDADDFADKVKLDWMYG